MIDIFEKSEPVSDAFTFDYLALYMNEIGGAIIALGFIVCGAICMKLASNTYPPTYARRTSIKIFGMFLILAGIVRGFDVLAYWYNFGYIRGILKILCGCCFLWAAAFVPRVVRETILFKELMEVEEKIDETKEKLKIVEEISRKLDTR